MAESKSTLKRRRWADIVVLVAAVYLFLAAVWSPLELLSGGGADEVSDTGGLIYTYAIAGALALAGLFIAHRARIPGRIAVGAAGLISLYGLTQLHDLTLLGIISLGLPGVAMIVSAFFVGPMPTPEEEGQPRSMPQP